MVEIDIADAGTRHLANAVLAQAVSDAELLQPELIEKYKDLKREYMAVCELVIEARRIMANQGYPVTPEQKQNLFDLDKKRHTLSNHFRATDTIYKAAVGAVRWFKMPDALLHYWCEGAEIDTAYFVEKVKSHLLSAGAVWG